MTRDQAAWRLLLLLLVASCTTTTGGSITSTTAPTATSGSMPATTVTTRVTTTTQSTMDPTTTSTTTAASGTLLVVGDWGSGTSDQSEIAAQMEAVATAGQVDAILTTGDNFYEDDAATLLGPYQWAADSGVEFWVTWGNHDIESPSRIAAVEAAFGDPPHWTAKTWGQTEIVILDSNEVESEEQMRFLEEEMARIDGPTIVVFHHPAFSCSSHDDTESVEFGWVPAFDDDVVLVLSGHAHNFQRFEIEGTPYVVSGGGGRGLHPLDACEVGHPPRVAGVESFHFLTISQQPSELVVTAIDQDGSELDRFTVPLQP